MYNPATIDQTVVQLEADADENYTVELYNRDTKTWDAVDFD